MSLPRSLVMRSFVLRSLGFGVLALAMSSHAEAATVDGGLSEAEGERIVQGYLAMYSTDAGVSAGTVATFYAPTVVYYGKTFTRAEVLADKLAYIRRWPQRVYRETPGSLHGRCNTDQSVCRVSFDMTWRRIGRSHEISIGRARMSFDFVPLQGRRKIARESARIL